MDEATGRDDNDDDARASNGESPRFVTRDNTRQDRRCRDTFGDRLRWSEQVGEHGRDASHAVARHASLVRLAKPTREKTHASRRLDVD